MRLTLPLPPIEEPEEQVGQPHLSVTQINMVLTCPEQFRRRYVLGEKERPGGARVLGGAVHRAVEANYRHKIAHGEDLPTATVIDTFHEAWERVIDESGGVEEVTWDADESPNTMRQHGHALTGAYRQMISPRIQPVACEEAFWITEGLPMPLTGVIDLETPYGLVDLKVTGKRSKPKASWQFQARVYQLAKSLPFEWHVLTRTKLPGAYTAREFDDLHMRFDPLQNEITLRRIDFAARLIADQMARYGPNRSWDFLGLHHDWACGWCGFRPTCEAWRNA